MSGADCWLTHSHTHTNTHSQFFTSGNTFSRQKCTTLLGAWVQTDERMNGGSPYSEMDHNTDWWTRSWLVDHSIDLWTRIKALGPQYRVMDHNTDLFIFTPPFPPPPCHYIYKSNISSPDTWRYIAENCCWATAVAEDKHKQKSDCCLHTSLNVVLNSPHYVILNNTNIQKLSSWNDWSCNLRLFSFLSFHAKQLGSNVFGIFPHWRHRHRSVTNTS